MPDSRSSMHSHSEDKDVVEPLNSILEDSHKIMVEIKQNNVRDSLHWMKDALDDCSDRNSSDEELSDDSNVDSRNHMSQRRQTKQRIKVDEKALAHSGDEAPTDE